MISLFFCDFRSRLTDMGVGCGVVFWGMVNGFMDGIGGGTPSYLTSATYPLT